MGASNSKQPDKTEPSADQYSFLSGLLGVDIQQLMQQEAATDQALVWLPGRKVKAKGRRAQPAGLSPGTSIGPLGTALNADVPTPIRYGRERPDYEHGAGVAYDTTVQQPPSEETLDAVKNWLYRDDKRQAIIRYLDQAGYPVDKMSFEDIASVWEDAVQTSSSVYMTSVKTIKKSPWDILDLKAPDPQGKKPPKGQRFTSTLTTTDMADVPPEQARGIIFDALQKALGRGPSDEEMDDFVSRANAIAMANPRTSVTTTTNEWDKDLEGYKQVAQDTKTTGPDQSGMSAMLDEEARERARNNPEYDSAQAANFFAPALMQALASPVPGTG